MYNGLRTVRVAVILSIESNVAQIIDFNKVPNIVIRTFARKYLLFFLFAWCVPYLYRE